MVNSDDALSRRTLTRYKKRLRLAFRDAILTQDEKMFRLRDQQRGTPYLVDRLGLVARRTLRRARPRRNFKTVA